MSKRTTKNYVLLFAALAVCLGFLIGSVFYLSFVYRRSNEQSLQHLQDTATQVNASLAQQIESDFQLLRGVALSLGELGVDNNDEVHSLLQQINNSNAFVRMGFFAPSGIGNMVDLSGTLYTEIDFSAEAFFTQALAGQEVVTSIIKGPVTGEQTNYYAVPVIQNYSIIGVLCAANRGQVFQDILDIPVFQGEGGFTIVNQAGQIVGSTLQNNPLLPHGASYEDIGQFTADESERFARALVLHEGGIFTFNVDAAQYTAVLQPFAFNNWFILAVVPNTAINQYYNQTLLGALLVIAAACLIFLFMLYSQRRNLQNNQKELARIAYTDPLTGSSNYIKFQQDAAKLLKRHPHSPWVIWSLDIKQFKRINDVFGHKNGDTLLKETAYILEQEQQQQPNMLFCHISADQFAGLLPYENTEKLEAWCGSLEQKMNDHDITVTRQMPVEIGLGFYIVQPTERQEPVLDMVNRANIAKQFAKDEIGSCIAIYNQDMGERVRREATLEAAAPAALANGEFLFYLQPKVNIQNGCRISGAEALARWNSPQLGFISPVEFVPLFERNGFIVQMDRYMFEHACRWYRAYMDAGNPAIHLAINISRLSFLQEDFIPHYVSVKEKYAIPDGALELELTENIVLFDYQSHIHAVRQLQENGFMCSIDDFGSGYSSLNVLKNLPVDVIKLDAVFFRGSINISRERTVIAGFLRMAKELGILTVAEGVETFDQVDFLRGANCDIVQGYVFSKPLTPEDFTLFAQQHKDGTLCPD